MTNDIFVYAGWLHMKHIIPICSRLRMCVCNICFHGSSQSKLVCWENQSTTKRHGYYSAKEKPQYFVVRSIYWQSYYLSLLLYPHSHVCFRLELCLRARVRLSHQTSFNFTWNTTRAYGNLIWMIGMFYNKWIHTNSLASYRKATNMRSNH